MDFTKLPTDNFYIFISFAGLGLIVYFISLFFRKSTEINKAINDINKEAIKQSLDLNYFKSKVDFTSNQIHLFAQAFKINYGFDFPKSDKNEPNKIIIPDQIIKDNKTESYIKDYLKIEKIFLIQDKEFGVIDGSVQLITKETDILEEKMLELRLLTRISKTACIIGMMLIFFGTISWYFKHQKYQDELIEINYEKSFKDLKKDSLPN